MSDDDLDRALERARQANERAEAARAKSSAASEEFLRKRGAERTQFEAFISTLRKELSAATTKLDQAGIPRIALDPSHPGPLAAKLEMKNVGGGMSIFGKLFISESTLNLEIDWDKPIQIGSLGIPDRGYPVGSVEPKQIITAMIDAYTQAINQRASS